MDAIERAKDLNGYALFFDMGAGKTCTAINILRHKCYNENRLLKTLVLCPPVVRENWRREFLTHSTIPGDKIHVLDGSSKKRLEKFQQNDGIFITNYESLIMKDLFKAFHNWRPEMLIADESHKLKSPKSKRTKAAISLADVSKYKLLLTGTPILNTGMDIWSQFRILDGGQTFDKNFYAFRAKWFVDKNAGMPRQQYFPKWVPIPGMEESFNKKIYQKASRVLKKDCLELPPLVRERVEVEMSPEQMRMYKAMEKDFIAYLDGKACVASIALTKVLRLQQIVSGFFTDDAGENHCFETNPRLNALKDILEGISSDHKIVVWATFRASYGPISNICDRLGIEYVTLYGGMSDKERQKAIDSFQGDKKVRVVIANQAAGGTGVGLTSASYSVYFSRSFNLEHDSQSEARNYRGGSEIHEKVTRIDLVAPGTIDETILDALSRKENIANNILKLRERFCP